MENKEVVTYTSSDGTETNVKDLEFTHLSNALAKKYREVFNSTNKNEFVEQLKTINNLKEEAHRRINEFYDGLGE